MTPVDDEAKKLARVREITRVVDVVHTTSLEYDKARRRWRAIFPSDPLVDFPEPFQHKIPRPEDVITLSPESMKKLREERVPGICLQNMFFFCDPANILRFFFL